MNSINKYPLSGFSKISYEEFLGILHILNLYSSLDEDQKNMVNLMMDGLKFRENSEEKERGINRE